MTRERVETDVEGGHYRIEIAVDGKPNPLDGRTMSELDEALSEVEANDSVVVVSIVGRGDAFSAGADLETIAEWVRTDRWDELLGFLRDGQALMNRVDGLEVPTVAGINGYALGGGLELALACDLRVAAESASLGFPESTLGMIPGWGGTQRLPAVVGASAAKELVLTGDSVDSETARSLGLVDRHVPDGELHETVDDYADRIADKPPATIRYLLDAIDAGTPSPTDAALSHELVCDLLASVEPETERRIDSFLDE